MAYSRGFCELPVSLSAVLTDAGAADIQSDASQHFLEMGASMTKIKVSDLDYALKALRSLCVAIKIGFDEDPGHSDLDNEQPINVRMTLGDYRRAKRLLYELERP